MILHVFAASATGATSPHSATGATSPHSATGATSPHSATSATSPHQKLDRKIRLSQTQIL